MKGDFSRRTFDPAKQYSAVLQEQGRMLTDADLEEEHRILADRIEEGAADLIGGCGGPIDKAGFEITGAANDLALSAGRYYVDGARAECLTATTLKGQPYRHDVSWPPEAAGWYHIYLDVWRRLVTALDDPAIREVALGGPTTAAREQTVWQAKAIRDELGDVEGREPTCLDPLPDLGETTGSLAAQADPEAATTDPCEVPPSAGFKGLENQLYRVEVHETGEAYDLADPPEAYRIDSFVSEAPTVIRLEEALPAGEVEVGHAVEIYVEGAPERGTLAHIVAINDDRDEATISVDVPSFATGDVPRLRRVEATYVWSRDNGSVVTVIDRIDGDEITVRDLGRDDVLGFAEGQWVEITDDVNDFEGRPGQLRQIAAIDEARNLVRLSAAVDPLEPVDPADPEDPGVDPGRHPKLRRWDGAGGIVFNGGDPLWLSLEDGIQVRFTAGNYRTGDWWHFPARTATIDPALGNIEWPRDATDAPALLPPRGIEHHSCRLALVEVTGEGDVSDPIDCRNLFPPVTELTSLLYVSGDGQEGVPDPANPGSRSVPLGAPLEVRVANGSHPVTGAQVEFIIDGPPQYAASNGRLQNTNLKTATVETNDDGIARCTWHLDGSTATQTCTARLLDAASERIPNQVVVFHASLSTAARVAYTPSPECDDLASAKTVQGAIDLLCQRDPVGGGRCCCVAVGRDGEFEDIATAIEELLGREEGAICLCLLPGDHELADFKLDLSKGERAITLSISGCGRASRLHLLKGARLQGLRELALRRLDIGVEPGASIDVRQTRHVVVDECRVFGVPEGRGLVRVHGAARIRVASSTLEAIHGGSLEIISGVLDGLDAPGVDVLMELFATIPMREFDRRAQEVARELRDRTGDERQALAKALLTRVREMGQALSVGESVAWRRIAETLMRDEPDFWAIVDHLFGVRFATGRADPAGALEIGNLVSDEGREPEFADTRDGAVTLENNDIVGLVSFYGMADAGHAFSVDHVLRLRGLLRERVGTLGGSDLDVHVRDNHLTRLALGRELAAHLEQWSGEGEAATRALIGSFHCTDNIVDGVISEIAARHVSLAHNQFTLAALRDIGGQDAQRVADVIGDSAVYTGNHGQRTGFPFTVHDQIADSTRVSAEAANLEIDFVP